MKKLIAVICFMLATSPLALAQDKGKVDATKAAPAAETSTKAAPKPAKAKKEPTEKQKAQQEKMKSCSKEASAKKLKGDERKTFMSGCMSAQPKADGDKAPAKK
jgi:psiF repeat